MTGKETAWPTEYMKAMNGAVNSALSKPIEESLSEIDKVLGEFRSHHAFLGKLEELEKSVLRNRIIAATLSYDNSVSNILRALLIEVDHCEFFDQEERNFLKKAILGKIASLGS